MAQITRNTSANGVDPSYLQLSSCNSSNSSMIVYTSRYFSFDDGSDKMRKAEAYGEETIQQGTSDLGGRPSTTL